MESQEGWPFGCMFAAASVGHRYKFLREGDTGPPADVGVIMQLCKIFKNDGYRTTLFQRQESDSDGTCMTTGDHVML